MTHCWYYDVSELSQGERFGKGLQRLPWPERREKALKYKQNMDRYRSLGASLLLLHALKEAGVSDLALSVGPHGKPSLARDQGVFFNLSHSGQYAVCAVSDDSVGVDVQVKLNRDSILRHFLLHCCHSDELNWMTYNGIFPHSFYELWTRKESYLKAIGSGFTVDPKSICVLKDTQLPLPFHFHDTRIDDHYLCVCDRSEERVRFEEVSGLWQEE